MDTALENSKDIALRVPLEGNLGLRDVNQVRQLLGDAMSASNTVEVDVRDLTGIDISIVQLVLAARKSAEQFGQALNLVTKSEGVFEAILVKAGFLGADGVGRTADEGFWAGLPAQAKRAAS